MHLLSICSLKSKRVKKCSTRSIKTLNSKLKNKSSGTQMEEHIYQIKLQWVLLSVNPIPKCKSALMWGIFKFKIDI